MCISKWDIVVIRAHHWIWEEMYSLEALTTIQLACSFHIHWSHISLHKNGFHSSDQRESLQVWLFLKGRLSCITLVQALSTRWTTSQKACISLSLVPLNREKGSRFNLFCYSKGWRCWLHYFVASHTALRLLAFFSNSELPLCCISTYTLEAQLNHTHSSLNWIPPWMVGSCSFNHKTISRSISKGEHKRVEQRRSDVDPALQWDVVVMLLLPIFRIEWTSVTWQRAHEGWKTASLYPTWTSPSHHEPSTVSGTLITVRRLGISWNHDHQPQMFHLHPPIHICYIRLLQLDNEVNPIWSGACQHK